MGMTKNELRQRIVRNLGGGMIKTELCREHLDDAINQARDLWIQWTVDNSTMEVYFLLLLEAKKSVYDMPAGITEILGYEDKMGGIGAGGYGYDSELTSYGPGRWYTGPEQGNTAFFSLQSPDWVGLGYSMRGPGNMFSLIDTHLAIGHLELIRKMRHDKYQWRYHRFANQIELIPTPECGNSLQVGVASAGPPPSSCPGEFDTYEYIDSPGYVLIRGYMMEGASLPTYTPGTSANNEYYDHDRRSFFPQVDINYSEHLYSHPWIIEYATAYSMRTLGYIRRKFSNNSTLGNTSISLDGDSLVSEANDRMRDLEEDLDKKYSYSGYGIYVG